MEWNSKVWIIQEHILKIYDYIKNIQLNLPNFNFIAQVLIYQGIPNLLILIIRFIPYGTLLLVYLAKFIKAINNNN